MHGIRPPLWLPLAAALAIIGGCDGNDLPIFGPGEKGVSSGRFLDSAVANLDYQTPSRSGTTDSKGSFSYQGGESVSFSVGRVVLGEAAGQEIVTPVNLVADSSTATPAVRNITRFLLALDQDGDPGNGITISEAVRLAAQGWDTVDFAAADFDSNVAGILSSIGIADGRTVSMKSPAEAARHLERTIFCAYSGGFTGLFSGASQGEWMLIVDDEGGVSGVGRDGGGNRFRLDGRLNPDSSSSFWADYYLAGATQPNARWEGTISPSGAVNGSWESGSPPRITSLAGSRKLLNTPPGGGVLYRGTLQRSSGTLDDPFEIADVGVVLLRLDNGVLSGTGYLYLENREFTIPQTSVVSNRFNFRAAGKEFLGEITGDGIILAFSDLNSGNIGGGSSCRIP